MKDKISFIEFLEIEKKLEITYGVVTKAERVPKSKKLLKLNVYFGPEDQRDVVTNIGDKIEPERLIEKKFYFITNLEPVKMMGIESHAMIMLPTKNGQLIFENDNLVIDGRIGGNLL